MSYLRKSFILALVLTLVVGVLGLAPASRAAAAGDSPAAIMPANTALYAEVNAGDVNGMVNALAMLAHTFGIPFTADQALSGLDQGLSMTMGRAASFNKDIQPWLASIAFGLPVTDEMLASPTTAMQVPPIVALIAVTDDKAAAAFVDELIGKAQGTPMTKGSESLGAETAVTYVDSKKEVEAAVFKGYVAVGAPSGITAVFDTLKSNKPGLAADADFTKVTGLLKGPNSALLYVGKRAVQFSLAATSMAYATASSAMAAQQKQFLDAIMKLDTFNSFALALRGSDKVLALDMALSLNQDAIDKTYAQFGLPPLKFKQPAAKIAERVPGGAIGVLMWGDLAGLYRFFMGVLDVSLKQMAAQGSDYGVLKQMGLDQGVQNALENGLKAATGIDLQQDFLSWADGEFALYLAPTGGTAGLSDFPITTGLIIDASDAARASAFAEKISGLLTKSGLKPIQDASGLYSVPVSAAPALNIGYGVVKSTFALTLSAPADLKTVADAINGTGALPSNEVWQHVKAIVGDTNQPMLYLNLTALGAFANSSPLVAPADKTQWAMIANVFESVVFYGKDLGQGLSTATLALVQK